MKVFGFEIHRVKLEELFIQSKAHASMGIGLKGYRPLLQTYLHRTHTPFWKAIIWPSDLLLDGFKQVKYHKQLAEFAEWIEHYKKFNMCPVDELHKLGTFSYIPETQLMADQLRQLHCIAYENIPPDILQQIPSMLSAIFTEGKSLKDHTPTLEKPKPLLGHD